MLILAAGSVFGQSGTLGGTVLDETRQPVIGATVRLKKDSKVGTVTDIDGRFSIKAKAGDVIIVSFVGYKTQEVTASPKMTIHLEPSAEMLEDVVVIGYMPRKVANTSASVVKISGKELSNKPSINPLDATQGKVAGLQVYSTSGEPSAPLSLTLHGQGSLGAGSSPLYIVDGMAVGAHTVQAMNPNDFESVQFLKDAAATSIYGARAANGVIYITTKRGEAGEKAHVSVRTQYGVSTLANADYFKQLMNTQELFRYLTETKHESLERFMSMYHQAHGAESDPLIDGSSDDFVWYNYIYHTAPTYSADINISGGGGKTNYYISGGFMEQNGLREGSTYRKLFGRINLNTELSKALRMGLNLSASYDKARTSPFSQASGVGGGLAPLNLPFLSPYDINGNEYDYNALPRYYSIMHSVAKRPSGNGAFNFSANGQATWTPLPYLTLRSVLGLELAYGNSWGRVLPSYGPANGVGTSSRSFSLVKNLTSSNTISYSRELWEKHHATVLVGHEFIDYHDESFSASGSGLSDDRLVLLSHTTRDKSVGEGRTQYAFLSFFGQLSYDYAEKYFVDLVLRNDASSRFEAKQRNAQFWSAGLLWKVKKEEFLSDTKWLNDLDLKLSYGTQGNASIPPFSIQTYAYRSGQYRGESGYGIANLGNDDLTWERQNKFTVGLKGRLFDLFSFNLEYYHRLTSDMLFEVPLPHSAGIPLSGIGVATMYKNIGKYLNQGIDLRLDADLLKHKDYNLSLWTSFNYNRDKVVELFDGRQSWIEPGTSLGYIVGEPVMFVVPIFKGINPNNGLPTWYKPGEDKAVTTKDDNNVTTEWASSLEQNTGVPAFTPVSGGFGMRADWRGVYLTADFSFTIGKHMLSLDKQYFENEVTLLNEFNVSRSLFNYWKNPGDQADFPRIDYIRDRQGVSSWLDTKLLENSSFIRLKGLTLGYTLPQSFLKRQGFISGANIFFTGRNLLTFTEYEGIDPEVNRNAYFGANPNTRQFTLGAELTF